MELILGFAAVAAFFGGLIGLVQPRWVNLPSRWIAFILLTACLVPLGAAIEFFPAAGQRPAHGAFLQFLAVWGVLSALLWNAMRLRSRNPVKLEGVSAATHGLRDEIPDWSEAQQSFANSAERHKTLELAVQNKRVTPPVPVGRKPKTSAKRKEAAPKSIVRDHTSGWACFIRYVDAKGDETERRIVVRRVEGYGKATTISAWCFEREAYRTFRVSNIEDLVCADTGEVLDPRTEFDRLAREGAVGITDKSLSDLVTILVFLARCDGEYHADEMASVNAAIQDHVAYFGGEQAIVAKVKANARRLAPDGDDFMNALRRIRLHKHPEKLADFVLMACDLLIEADGRIAPEEKRWLELVEEDLESLVMAAA